MTNDDRPSHGLFELFGFANSATTSHEKSGEKSNDKMPKMCQESLSFQAFGDRVMVVF